MERGTHLDFIFRLLVIFCRNGHKMTQSTFTAFQSAINQIPRKVPLRKELLAVELTMGLFQQLKRLYGGTVTCNSSAKNYLQYNIYKGT